ncbi:MAG: hypothetical protein KC486_11460 [Myxococcales bacterium]|nr:hypothetical protein [Myxococcales bacterium]
MSAEVDATAERSDDAPRLRVMGLLRYTAPFHALLPVIIAGVGREREVAITIAIVVLHVLFPVVLALTYPLWRGQGGDVVALLVINHIVTFAVAFGLTLLLT